MIGPLMRHSRLVATLGLFIAGCHHPKVTPVADGGVVHDGFVPSLDAACATSSAQAAIKHLNISIVYDRSNSMGGTGSGIDPATKWLPVGAGLKSFFEDPGSVGVTASLVYFPSVQNPADKCNSGAYSKPDVPPTALPSSAFAASIEATSPYGNTPTLPAVQGVIGALQSGVVNPKTVDAIILVIDGEPDSCQSSVNDVSQAVQTVALTIPTYVIGIGLSSAALDQIAAAGGTKQAIVVDVTSPTQTQADLLAALDAIRGKQVPCAFAIPPAPDGQQLDYDKVNVLYTPGSGTQQALTYQVGCANGTGWYYDDVTSPKHIELCPTTCTTVQQDKGARVDILLGCATAGPL